MTTTTTVPVICGSATYTWFGHEGINAAAPTFDTGVTIPTTSAPATAKITSIVVQTYDAQPAGTTPTRVNQRENGEQIGIRIGTTDVVALSADLPDTVRKGATDENYSGVQSSTLTAWANTPITGGMITIRHGSLYTNNTNSNSLTAYSVTANVQTCAPGGPPAPTTTTTTTAPASTTTAAATTTTELVTTTTVGVICGSATYTWFGHEGINAAAPTFDTGVTIPTTSAPATAKITSIVVQTYDAQPAGTTPTRVNQRENGEQIGIRIGTTDVVALSADLPDTVRKGATDENYSGIQSSTLTAWANTPITGGMITIRHGSLYTNNTNSNSLTAYSVTANVQTCTGG